MCFFLFIFFFCFFFFFQAEDGIRDPLVTGVQTCALPISLRGWEYCCHLGVAKCESSALLLLTIVSAEFFFLAQLTATLHITFRSETSVLPALRAEELD